MSKNEWKVPYIDLPRQFQNLEKELTSEFKRVMGEGAFILRGDVKKFEDNIATYLGVRNVIGVNSGTDALYLSTEAAGINPGDEIITVAHSFVATVAAIIRRNATPVFVDIGDDYNIDPNKIEEKITSRTKAILPVHLHGRTCCMNELERIAKENRLMIIEDAAQALGSSYKGRMAGSFGLCGCFSAHPMKILGGAGDAGFISTNNDELAEKLRCLRNHGQRSRTDISFFGYGSRIDNLQAALLNIKFKHLSEWIRRRRDIASIYDQELIELPLGLPEKPSGADHFDVYSSYVIRSPSRDKIQEHLTSKGIETFVHIPRPLYEYSGLGLRDVHLLNNERICKENLSLPIFPEMNNEQVDYVIRSIREFSSK